MYKYLNLNYIIYNILKWKKFINDEKYKQYFK